MKHIYSYLRAMLVLLFLASGIGTAWGETNVSSFNNIKGQTPAAIFEATSTGTNGQYASGTVFTLTSKESNIWTLVSDTGGSNVYFTMNNSEGGFHVGSGSLAAGNITLTSASSFNNVTSVVVKAKTGRDGSATFGVTVGGTNFTTGNNANTGVISGTTATEIDFSGTNTGNVVVSISDVAAGSKSVAVYVESVVITYSSASTTYTLTYNWNGGSGEPASYIGSGDITLPSTGTREGYTFNGWNTESNGSGASYTAGATYNLIANATLYAQWTANGTGGEGGNEGGEDVGRTIEFKSYGNSIAVDKDNKNWNTSGTIGSSELPSDMTSTTTGSRGVGLQAVNTTLTSTESFTNITKIVVDYSYNKSESAAFEVYVGTTKIGELCSFSSSTVHGKHTVSSTTPLSGTIQVKVTTRTQGTIWIGGFVVTTGESGEEGEDPEPSTKYGITANAATNGTYSVNGTNISGYQFIANVAAAGETVALVAAPASGYKATTGCWGVYDADAQLITVTGSGNTYTFSMPAGIVSITPIFVEDDSTPGEPAKGTKENPYTVTEIIALNNPKVNAWVRGFIIGSVIDYKLHAGSDGSVITNIALGDAVDATDAAHWIPVQLLQGNIRTALNVVDNPSNVGREVLVYGSLEAYFSTQGLKSTLDYQFVGKAIPTLYFDPATYVVYVDETFAAPEPETLSDGDITYESNATAVADVNATSGAVTINGVGEATITATQVETSEYQEATASYTLKVVPRNVTVRTNGYGWATYAPSYNVTLPEQEGVHVLYIDKDEQESSAVVKTSDMADIFDIMGDDAEAMATGTGVLVQAAANTDVVFPVSKATTNLIDAELIGNMLVGVTAATPYDSNRTNAYIFTKKTVDGKDKVGFYIWKNGTLAANKCYLQLPEEQTQNAPQFIMLPGDDTATAIEEILGGEANAPMYDLQGRRVTGNYRGIVITNGKKLMTK